MEVKGVTVSKNAPNKLFIEKIRPVNLLNENASLQLMSFGNPLFEEMLKDLAPRPNSP